MAHIKPFRGLRYKLRKPGDLEKLIAPPYDMMDEKRIDSLYNADPLNVVRIIQNRRQPDDTENRDRHKRAAEFFRKCIADGRIAADERESLYIYRQKFTSGKEPVVRTGVIALVKLVDFEDGIVFPHEYTLAGPKADRYELLQEIHSHTELVFGIVPDNDKKLYESILAASTENPCGRFTDDNNTEHSICCNSDPETAKNVSTILSGRTILIADGHHRYETALKFAKETGNPSYGHIMMNLVSMADPGLVIRAFHRVLKKYPGTGNIDVLKSLGDYFNCTDLGEASLDAITGLLETGGNNRMLYMDSASGRLFGLVLNSEGEAYIDRNAAGRSAAWNHLDVSEINSIVVGGIMNLTPDSNVLHDVMDYVNDPAIAFENTVKRRNEIHGTFFIRPVDISVVNRIVSGRERMPQKSTNFFPKCYSGLVFNDMDAK
jgi:uncharacterized protein (DUF1015 family)